MARLAALKQVQTRYLAALSGAEQSSGGAGKVPEVAAILKEKQSVANGEALAPAFPLGLPASLQGSRTDFLKDAAAVQRDFLPRFSRIDTDYLRALLAFEARSGAAMTPEASRALAEEKGRLANGVAKFGASAPAPAAANATSGANLAANGNFAQLDANGAPAGWEVEGDICKVVADGSAKILRMNEPKGSKGGMYQSIPISHDYHSFEVKARVRMLDGDAKANRGCINVWGPPAGSEKWGVNLLGSVSGEKTKAWKPWHATFTPPANSDRIVIQFCPNGTQGTLDFADVEVLPKR